MGQGKGFDGRGGALSAPKVDRTIIAPRPRCFEGGQVRLEQEDRRGGAMKLVVMV